MRQMLHSFPVHESLLTRKQKCTLLCRVDAISFLSSSVSMPSGGTLLNQHIFPFHAPPLGGDTQCATIDQFSPQNSILAKTLLNYVVVLCMACLVTGSHCWPWILVFLHIVCIFGNTKHNFAGVSPSISVCYIFLHCMTTWQVSICCLPV